MRAAFSGISAQLPLLVLGLDSHLWWMKLLLQLLCLKAGKCVCSVGCEAHRSRDHGGMLPRWHKTLWLGCTAVRAVAMGARVQRM